MTTVPLALFRGGGRRRVPENDPEGKFVIPVQRFIHTLASEFGPIAPRFWLARMLAATLPEMRFIRIRTRLYRLAGLSVGRGTVILGRQHFTGEGALAGRLAIGADCVLNGCTTYNLGERVTIEDNASIGMQ